MPLPPGPVYLLKNLPSLLFPPLAVLISAKLAAHFSLGSLPLWALVAVTILSTPIGILLKVQLKDVLDHREAAKHGAVLPPRVDDRLPGGLGMLKKMLDNLKNGYPGDMFFEWTKVHGNTFNIKILFENRFFTSEPEYIKAILATKFDSFEKGSDFNAQMQSMLGTGVFNSDGEMWKFHRSMTRPFFSKDRISHFDLFDTHASTALSLLKTRLRAGYPVDIQDLASRFTMDCATEFLFGQDVCSLSAGIPYPDYIVSAQPNMALALGPAERFSRAFDEAQRRIAVRARMGPNWPLAEFWKDKVQEQMVVVNGFIEPIMRAAVERKRMATKAADGNEQEKMGHRSWATGEKEREVKDGESLLDHLINYTEDETVLRDEILNILLAGRDTTTNSITFSIYMLAEHPEVLKRLRQEILEKVGETRRPTFEDMKDMKYLRAVINETIRLYPAVPFNVRTSSKAVILPGKYGDKPFYIPAKSRFPYSVFLMHRRTDLWGPDAHEFDPDRFLDDRLRKYITPNPFIFLPFNAGPRICLGQQFAYHETSFFLIRLLQQFSSISHVPEAQPPASRPPVEWLGLEGSKGRDGIRIKTYVTMSAMGGCWVNMEEAVHDEVEQSAT